jgi:hypothetical protein
MSLNNSIISFEEMDIDQAFNNNFNWEKDHLEQDDAVSYESHNQVCCLNQKTKINEECCANLENKKTKYNTIVTGQTKPIEEKNEKITKLFNISNINDQPSKFLEKKRGRKTKDFAGNGKKGHDKNDQDNIMRKIKTNIFDLSAKKLNESIGDNESKFYKIDKRVSENLKKSYNIKLMNSTIKDIYIRNKISRKFKKLENKYANVELINKIYEEKTKVETIKILDKKLIEFIKEIRENELEKFLTIIENKEKRSNCINIKDYMESLTNLLMGYEEWFNSKTGRERESKNKK